jgi:hypothetical protein
MKAKLGTSHLARTPGRTRILHSISLGPIATQRCVEPFESPADVYCEQGRSEHPGVLFADLNGVPVPEYATHLNPANDAARVKDVKNGRQKRRPPDDQFNLAA